MRVLATVAATSAFASFAAAMFGAATISMLQMFV